MKKKVSVIIAIFITCLLAMICYFIYNPGNSNDNKVHSGYTIRENDENIDTILADEDKTINDCEGRAHSIHNKDGKRNKSDMQTARKLYSILISQQVFLPSD